VWASNTTATITAGQIILQTASDGAAYLASSVNVTLNSATSGAGGLDTGSLAASSWYYVYLIYNGTTVNALMSASATSPTLPFGYTYVTSAIGAVRTDGSKNFLGFIQYGRDWQYVVGNNLSSLPQMISGSSGSVSTPTWTSVATGDFVPSTAAKITLSLATINTATMIAMAAPNSNYGGYQSTTNLPPLLCVSIASENWESFVGEFVLESSNIYYTASGGGYLYCLGFTLNI